MFEWTENRIMNDNPLSVAYLKICLYRLIHNFKAEFHSNFAADFTRNAKRAQLTRASIKMLEAALV